MNVLSTFLKSSLNFLSHNLKKHYEIILQSGGKAVSKFELSERQSETQLPVKPTWSVKMTVLSTFLESSLNFLSNDLQKHYKSWYSQVEKRSQSLNC